MGELSGPVFHKLQHSHRMFSANSWKISEKIVKPISLLDIVDKRLHRDARAGETTAPLMTFPDRVTSGCGTGIAHLLLNQLAASSKSPIQSPSFPHALSGNPGESGSGPLIKTFGGDGSRKLVLKVIRYPVACCAVDHYPVSISKLKTGV